MVIEEESNTVNGTIRSNPPTNLKAVSTQNSTNDDGLIGQILFGSYAVLQLIGEGPMSRVYLAKHVASEQLVALKTLTRNEPELIEAFAKDARSNHRLDHPNILRTLGYFESSGAPFVVMEFVEGITLSELLEVHLKIDKDEELTNVVFQVCDALAFAHEHRVLHANLKPQNVMIFERNNQVLVKVANFGSNLIEAAIKLADDNLVEYPHDPGTLSPEQVLEERLNPPQTDVYWLGALTYKLASGCVPYNTKSVAELVSAFHSHAELDPLVKLNTNLRSAGELGLLLHDALSQDPQKRPPSVQVFKERLNTWLKSSQYAKEAQVPSLDLQSVDEFRDEADIMNRRATREVLTASIHNLVVLRKKQVDQEETVMMQFTTTMAAKGPRQSPTKTAANMILVVSTIAFFFASLTFYLLTNGDELREAWTSTSRQLSAAIWGAKKEAPVMADDEFIIEEPVVSSSKGMKKLPKQRQIATADSAKPAAAAQTRQVRFKYEEDPFYSKWITHDKFTDVRRLETE